MTLFENFERRDNFSPFSIKRKIPPPTPCSDPERINDGYSGGGISLTANFEGTLLEKQLRAKNKWNQTTDISHQSKFWMARCVFGLYYWPKVKTGVYACPAPPTFTSFALHPLFCLFCPIPYWRSSKSPCNPAIRHNSFPINWLTNINNLTLVFAMVIFCLGTKGGPF